ncbi:MAG: CfrBI family restriction endonuclease [Clostridiales bacterium]|nr:CfrBI family restriction endonuclease [Clostridiales bacterium]
MEYHIEQYNDWLSSNIGLIDAFSEDALRSLTLHLLLGRNYRLVTEQNTKSRQILTHLWLSDVAKNAKMSFGDNWRIKLLEDLSCIRRKSKEQKYLQIWLTGLTNKTLKNIGGTQNDLPDILETLEHHIQTLLMTINREDDIDHAWLLMMAGAATLSIRGTDKSKIGKRLEHVFIRSALTILGLQENTNFWMNVDRDLEVDRETDAEVETSRGRIRIEVGLIASGNQEVVEDKINRVGDNGVVIFDMVGSRTRIYDTANRRRVKLIQIRHGNPLQELYNHLSPLTRAALHNPPSSEEEIKESVLQLDSSVFT